MRPSYVRLDAWEAVWANFTGQVGSTWGDYLAMLDENAAYLGRLGTRVDDVSQLLALEFRQADGLSPLSYLAGATDAFVQGTGLPIVFQRAYGQPISRRFELGPLGCGWAHIWQMILEEKTDGTVVITDMTGTPRIFQPHSLKPGRYFTQPGDYGILTPGSGGAFTLREVDGVVFAFRADGKLDHVEDANGNRITCIHAGDLLTGLTHSSGQSLDIAYNSAGRITSIIDPDGRETVFTYDAANEHLRSVREYDGRITWYDYAQGQGAAREHALTEIAFPGGSHQYFAYDDRGRLATMSRDGGAEQVGFAYDSVAKVSVTDAVGATSGLWFDNWGRVLKAEDALDSAVNLSFDRYHNLTRVVDPAGRSYDFRYNAWGQLSQMMDPLGHKTYFGHFGDVEPLVDPPLTLPPPGGLPDLGSTPGGRRDLLAFVLDANDNLTQYGYDADGNLNSITYADGSRETWSYDDGNPTEWTNRRGNDVQYTFDADGRLRREAYADGSHVDYTYDPRGNLIQTIDPNGTTTFAYDDFDYLTRIDYPVPEGQPARWLQFTYDAAGRRASSLDQLGHRLDYQYDAAGRLESMTDETGAELVHYTYDSVGRLQSKDLGNGVYTTYEYDDAGQLRHLVNRKSDGTVLSRFDYTYDSRGRRSEMNTHYGLWTYGYDDLGQLRHAVLESTDSQIPDQDLTYVYDKMGNRIRTIENGVTTEYAPNDLNQYTRVGDTTYLFDLDGNLIEEHSSEGDAYYTYNDENRLVAVTRTSDGQTDTWQYTYDAFGQRTASAENGVVTHFVIDPIGLGNVVGEYGAAGNRIASYDHGFGLLSRIAPSDDVTYYVFDAIGNTAESTTADGIVANRYAYEPFGKALSVDETIPNAFEFVGEPGVIEETNGMHYMRARYYSPSLGRFLTTDRLRLASGDVNLYRYVVNAPSQGIDPLGLGPPLKSG
jgi:RHS repeat-associated protein